MSRATSRVYTWILSHRQLMDESLGFLEHAQESGTEFQKDIAEAVLLSPDRYVLWRQSHGQAMRTPSTARTTMHQMISLREVALNQVPKAALFAFFQRHKSDRADRELLLNAFGATRDYQEAILAAHDSYVIAEASGLCARYLAMKLGDVDHKEWYQEYLEAYNAYYALYCQALIQAARGEELPMAAMLGELKKRISEARSRILVEETVAPRASRTPNSLVRQSLLRRLLKT